MQKEPMAMLVTTFTYISLHYTNKGHSTCVKIASSEHNDYPLIKHRLHVTVVWVKTEVKAVILNEVQK
jgi:sialic acid synthase SpsE